MIPQKFRVEKNTEETHDTFTLSLHSENPSSPLSFSPGQFNMLYVFGIGEVPISISGNPARPEILKHTIKDVGPTTSALRKLRKGDAIGVRGPYGVPWPIEKAMGKDIIIISGGIGLAPLRPTFYHLTTNRNKFGRIALLFGARTPQDLLYKKEIAKWRSRLDLQVLVTVDHAPSDWYGRVGVVPALVPKVYFDPKNSLAMICGPEIMIRFTLRELVDKGIQKENIYVSMERNMKCGIGLCGHCQHGPNFVCKNGPVFPYNQIEHLFRFPEI